MVDDSFVAPTVAVVGAGLMGHGIAQVFAVAGAPTRVWDPDTVTLRRVPDRIRAHLDAIGHSANADVELARTLEDAVEGVDLIVEAAPESLDTKRGLMAQFDVFAPEALVATNTSVLRISEIAEGSARPERIVGTHWWNPPYLIPIVEVVRGAHTDEKTARRVSDWLRFAGKIPVDVNWDAPGFIGNRMQFALWREAASIVEQGICDAATVDLVARNTFGARLAAMGPLENADYIGLDLTVSIMNYLSPHLATTQASPTLFSDAVARGDVGAKAGRGVLAWPSGSRERTEERLLAHLSGPVSVQRD